MNEMIKYSAIGMASFAIFATISYLSPFTAVLVFAMVIATGLSYVMGFAIFESYQIWTNHDKNKSGKKTPSSKDVG